MKATNLLVQRNGRSLMVQTACNMLQRVRAKVGFALHAHRFRHTFATEYLWRGGETERLRRILGHTTYVMVMRYVHLDKGDLSKERRALPLLTLVSRECLRAVAVFRRRGG
jgi:site-specific recombinase XerD